MCGLMTETCLHVTHDCMDTMHILQATSVTSSTVFTAGYSSVRRNVFVMEEHFSPDWQVVGLSTAFLASFDAAIGYSVHHYRLLCPPLIIGAVLNINVDASCSLPEGCRRCYRWDHHGSVVACQVIPFSGCCDARVAEATTITYGLRLAVELQFAQVWVESDVANVVLAHQLTTSQFDISTVGFHLTNACQFLHDRHGFRVVERARKEYKLFAYFTLLFFAEENSGMAETESRASHTKRHEEHQNDDFQGEYDGEDGELEDEEEKGVSRVTESGGAGAALSSDAGLRDCQLKTLANDDRSEGKIFFKCVLWGKKWVKVNANSEPKEGAEFKEKVNIAHQEVSATLTVQSAEGSTQNQLQSFISPTSLAQLSPTSVTQGISSASTTPLQEQSLSDQKVNGASAPEANQQKSYNLKMVSVVPILKRPASDGYNWRKYGQKQVKSPKGSRSYYKCTFSDCQAKKIECSDLTGHVIEIVNKGMHSHEPPRKNNPARESKKVSSAAHASHNIVTVQPIRIHNDSDPSTSSKDSVPETTVNPERKRPCSSGSDGNDNVQVKEELTTGDVGISGDGYRWRKYGQKMVKGNSNPRNYYRCTSAGCPVRKHIETAVDNKNAVIITYKGVHDHGMPVPKKRHGQPNAPLVAAAAPASMNNIQLIKTDGGQSQVRSTQWSVGTEGELTGEALDLGGEKAIESARTLMSIGFEIKPC
ncbi:Purine permease 5 isoform 1 [Hibiscus syriacus]|uniref:Purine permease 5 isoform 1 n=1 Tax=Hibiscus syriacus TaxID=106335 RepID=A0A6A2WGY8_HIBSY|nr:Purine permease 5 isoform 1 [Hibiscus syriacus]